jgi:23S rRNA (guanosine2251-2'-O)-methyltransferase
VKASAGAVEHLLLCPVDDLAASLADLHVRGLRVAGADAGAPLAARDSDLRGPLAIVVGSEGQGLGAAVRRRCDVLVRIPLRGAIESLNAAVAGSILLFEAVAQRDRGRGLDGNAAPPGSATEATATPAEPPPEQRPKAAAKATPRPRTAAAPKPRKPRAAAAPTDAPGPPGDDVDARGELLPGGPQEPPDE